MALPSPAVVEHLRLSGDTDNGDAAAVEAAAAVLRGGGVVVLPTDTVYGLAALPTDPQAVARIWALKDRSPDQPLAVLVADAEQAQTIVDVDLDALAGADGPAWVRRFWPGPLTLVVPRAPASNDFALGGDPATIGVRCPAHPFVRALAAAVGPLAVTSANRHGDPTPPDAAAAAASLAEPPDLVVDGGPAGSVASTVVDLTGDEPRILRVGVLGAADLALVDPGAR